MEPEAFVEELKKQMEAAYKEWDNARDNQELYKRQLEEAESIEESADTKLGALWALIRSFGGYPLYKRGEDGGWWS